MKFSDRESVMSNLKAKQEWKYIIKCILRNNLILISFILINFTGLKSQNTESLPGKIFDSEIVQFIGQYPMQGNGKKPSFIAKFGELVFGEKAGVVKKPINIIAYNPDHFWILDQGNGVLFENNIKSEKIPIAIVRSNELFNSLVGLCFLPNDEILFTDSRQNRIYLLSHGGKKLDILNDSFSLAQPTGIAFCSQTEEIWVVETAAHRISLLNRQGEIVRQFGERGNTPGCFNFPTHIWIDRTGKVYIIDSMNFRVQIFNFKGEFLMEFGKAGDATGNFSRPKGIATDQTGNIYIVDALFNAIQIFDKDGKFLYYFGSQGQDAGQFWMPTGLFIDKNNYIYVADSYNSRIQIFKLVNEDL